VLAVGVLDAVQVVVGQLDRADLALADEGALFHGGQVVQLRHTSNLARALVSRLAPLAPQPAAALVRC
jgi:hypothetical protein